MNAIHYQTMPNLKLVAAIRGRVLQRAATVSQLIYCPGLCAHPTKYRNYLPIKQLKNEKLSKL